MRRLTFFLKRSSMCFASNSMSSPRAQRRFVDLQHARTVIQIGSKPPFHYRRFHVIVSGRDDAHVDPAWTRGHLAVLRYAFAGSARGLPIFRAAGRQYHRRALFPQKHCPAMDPPPPDFSPPSPPPKTPTFPPP